MTTFLKLGLLTGTFTQQPQIHSTDTHRFSRRCKSANPAHPLKVPQYEQQQQQKEGRKKSCSSLWNFPFILCLQKKKNKETADTMAKQKSILSPIVPAAVSVHSERLSQRRRSLCRDAQKRHGRIVSAAEEENRTVTVERIGS